MKIEQHEEAYKEHLNNLKRAIEEGLHENQRNISYNVSQGSVELFAIFLHKLNLIQGSGEQFDHRIFKNISLIKEKLPLQFPEKEKILKLMKDIETERSALCYGNRKPIDRIEKMIHSFNNLREIINLKLNKNGKK